MEVSGGSETLTQAGRACHPPAFHPSGPEPRQGPATEKTTYPATSKGKGQFMQVPTCLHLCARVCNVDVCMHVCTRVALCAHNTAVHVRVNCTPAARMDTCTRVRLYLHVCVDPCACVCVHIHVFVHGCPDPHVCTLAVCKHMHTRVWCSVPTCDQGRAVGTCKPDSVDQGGCLGLASPPGTNCLWTQGWVTEGTLFTPQRRPQGYPEQQDTKPTF